MSRLQDLLDTSIGSRAFDIVSIELHVAAIQHCILGRCDIDKGGFHAGQNVLHLAQIDVAVNLGNVIGRTRNVMLDQVSAFEHRDLSGLGTNADRHHVAPYWATVALTALALFEGFVVEVWPVTTEDRFDRLRCPALALLALRLVLLGILRLLTLLGVLGVLSVLALLLTATATATTTTTTTASAIAASWLTRGLTLGLRSRLGAFRFGGGTAIANLWLRSCSGFAWSLCSRLGKLTRLGTAVSARRLSVGRVAHTIGRIRLSAT
ncbi:unannotated protein [freshwater metagenome]|uniref:Unannotated protein n=1 Tax=freshwater metagenome TaxID=449393 RepID=A0A6J6YUU9_9ZZZZ